MELLPLMQETRHDTEFTKQVLADPSETRDPKSVTEMPAFAPETMRVAGVNVTVAVVVAPLI
jgi:hypothetical protein